MVQFTNLKCTVQWFLVYSVVEPSQPILQHFRLKKKPLSINSHSPSPQPLATTYFLYLCKFAYSGYFRNRTTYNLLYPVAFTQYVFRVCAVPWISTSFLLWLNDIPLCEYATFGGYLGCFSFWGSVEWCCGERFYTRFCVDICIWVGA